MTVLREIGWAVLVGSYLTFSNSAAAEASLQQRLESIHPGSDGRVGICVISATNEATCVNGSQRFSLQSVMKLVVGAAVMDRIDSGGWRLEDKLSLHKEDLSLNVQPLARLVLETGRFDTTVGDLVDRAVTESDSAATDVLFARLGGAAAINAFLKRKGIVGIRVDRDERHLQTETDGLTWRSEFTDPATLQLARAQVSEANKVRAFEAYRNDVRDTATPFAMAHFLRMLVDGNLLSVPSTKFLVDVLKRTKTFPDRLRAGVPGTWTAAHKTGTSKTVNGINAVTNDVGILFPPEGEPIAIAVFVADSSLESSQRAKLIADAARAVTGQ